MFQNESTETKGTKVPGDDVEGKGSLPISRKQNVQEEHDAQYDGHDDLMVEHVEEVEETLLQRELRRMKEANPEGADINVAPRRANWDIKRWLGNNWIVE